jgi:hypothetical protein
MDNIALAIILFALGLLLWMICGAVAVWIVARKGNRTCSAFLVGAALGPIGIALALLAPNFGALRLQEQEQQIHAERQALKRGDFKLCPHCGKLVRPEAFICSSCGKNVRLANPSPTPSPDPTPSLELNENEPWQCQSCHRSNQGGGSFCEKCGARRTYN